MTSEDPLVRLSQLVRVGAHNRKSKTGKNEHVNAYVRKDLDVRSDLGTGKTKSGAFTSPAQAGVTPGVPDKPQKINTTPKAAPNLREATSAAPKAPAVKPGSHHENLQADVGDFHAALGQALGGKNAKIPGYRTTAPAPSKAHVAGAIKSVASHVGDLKDSDLRAAATDAKSPAVRRLLAKTPIPVLVASIKSKRDKIMGSRIAALAFATLVTHQNVIDQAAGSISAVYEPTQSIPDAPVPALATIYSQLTPVITALAPSIKQWLGLSRKDDESAMVRLSRLVEQREDEDLARQIALAVTRVEAHRSHDIHGKSIAVKSYLRHVRPHFGVGADSKTRRGEFVPSAAVAAQAVPAEKPSDPGIVSGPDGMKRYTDAGFSQHMSEVEGIVKSHLDLATDNVYSRPNPDNPKDRIWTRERTEAHNEIIRDILAKATAPGSPIGHDHQAVMTGGLWGAGKTTTLADPRSGIDRSRYLVLSADDMKEELTTRGLSPKVPGLSPMETSGLIHEESSYLASQLSDAAQAQGLNVIWDLSMANPGSIKKRTDQLKANGYNTRALFVDVSVDTSITRALGRYRAGEDQRLNGIGTGGRFVIPSVIRASSVNDAGFNSKNREAFEQMKGAFYDWQVWDTTGAPPKVVSQMPAGTRDRWADGLLHEKQQDGSWTTLPG